MFTNANVFGQILRASCFPVGTAGIILQAPTLYDDRPAIDELLSEIEAAIYTKPQDFNGPPGLYDIVWTTTTTTTEEQQHLQLHQIMKL